MTVPDGRAQEVQAQLEDYKKVSKAGSSDEWCRMYLRERTYTASPGEELWSSGIDRLEHADANLAKDNKHRRRLAIKVTNQVRKELMSTCTTSFEAGYLLSNSRN